MPRAGGEGRVMCKYCEEDWPITPRVADVPGMDIEMFL